MTNSRSFGILNDILSDLCELVPEGCVLLVKPGRTALIDSGFVTIKGTVNVSMEIVGQASEQQLRHLSDYRKK